MPIPAPWAVPDPVRKREHGLRRVSSATRWTAGAAAAGAIVLGAGYAHAATGSTTATKVPAPTQRVQQTPPPSDDGSGTSGTSGDDGGYGDDGSGSGGGGLFGGSGSLQAPQQAPQPVQQQPQTLSGGS